MMTETRGHVLSFTPEMSFQTCPRCEGAGRELVHLVGGEQQIVPCNKCDATGRFTALMEAEAESRYWRARWEAVRTNRRARKEFETCAENLEFWTNKAAMLARMRQPKAR